MKRDCLDIGTIQAFLDGELAPADSARVSHHIAACDACALALADAEEETAFVFSALEREMNTLVPTQRLWTRINDSIEDEKHHAPLWHRVWVFFAPFFASPTLVAASVVVIVFGVGTLIWVDRGDRSGGRPTNEINPSSPGVQNIASRGEVTPSPVDRPVEIARGGKFNDEQPVKPVNAYVHEDKRKVNSQTPARQAESGPKPGEVVNAAYLPGEASYVKTIADLSKSVDSSRDNLMRPSEQVAFARDMALVDDSIQKMRTAVRKYPKNESAKQVLYASYQNKIDLLNSVAQREDLVALK